MNKYILKCHTYWCGENNSFGIITNDINSPECLSAFDLIAYENFQSFSGFDGVLQDMFPEVEDEEYTDEQEYEATENEESYYGWDIEEYNEEEHGEWDWYGVEYQDSNE